MTAVIFEVGKPYWEVAKRFHTHRTNPAITPTAVRDMQRLQATTHSPAVRRRLSSFITRHQPKPQGTNPDGGGPRYA